MAGKQETQDEMEELEEELARDAAMLAEEAAEDYADYLASQHKHEDITPIPYGSYYSDDDFAYYDPAFDGVYIYAEPLHHRNQARAAYLGASPQRTTDEQGRTEAR